MSTSFLLYLTITGFAIAMALWVAASAAIRVREHDGLHRAVTFAAATLVAPVAIAAAIGPAFGIAELRFLLIAMPLLVVMGTWSNIITLRDQGFAIKAVHFPILGFNSLLIGIYAIRAIQEFVGLDLGTWGAAVTGGHVLLQQWVGQPHADTQPMWFHLPFLLPLWLRYQWAHKLALTACSFIALLMLAALTLRMPSAWSHADGYRGMEAETELDASQTIGVKVPWGDRLYTDVELDAMRDRYSEIGATILTVEVDVDVFDDPQLTAQVQRETDRARADGNQVVAIAVPPVDFQWTPALDLEQLAAEMGKVHWFAAEKLEPNYVVLYSGPFGRMASLIAETPTLDEWVGVIRRSARDLKRANPDVDAAVVIERQAPHAEALFRALISAESPVSIVGLALFADGLSADDLRRSLGVVHGWSSKIPGSKPIWILETGACPASSGGELGQWHFVRSVLGVAAANERIRAVCIDSLMDSGLGAYGLLNVLGRPRLTHERLRERSSPRPIRPPR